MSLGFFHTGGGSSNSVLGGQISTLALAETQGLLLPDVSVADATAGITHYACICIKNTGAATINNAGIYLSSVVTKSGIAFAAGLTGKNSTTEQTIANQTTVPTGNFVFVSKQFAYDPLYIGTLAPGEFYHLWVRRIVEANASGALNDYIILTGVE